MSNLSQIRYNSYYQLWLITLNASITSFNYGFLISGFNQLRYQKIKSNSSNGDSYIEGFITVSTIIQSLLGGIGALITASVINKIGRLKLFLILDICIVAMSFFLFVPNQQILILLENVKEGVVGIMSWLPLLYIKQIIPRQISLQFCFCPQVSMQVGSSFYYLFASSLGSIFSNDYYSRIIFIIPLISSVYQYYNFRHSLQIETPKWLYLNSQADEALNTLKVIYKQNYLHQAAQQFGFQFAAQLSQKNNLMLNLSSEKRQYSYCFKFEKSQQLIGEISLKTSFLLNNKAAFFKSSKLAIIASFLLGLQGQLTGIQLILVCYEQTVRSLHPLMQAIFKIVFTLGSIAGLFLLIHILNKLGRKKSLLYFSNSICLLQAVVAFSYFILDLDLPFFFFQVIQYFLSIFFFAIRFIFNLFFSPICLIYICQVVDATAVAYGQMICCLLSTIVSSIFVLIKQGVRQKMGWIFLFYSSLMYISRILKKKILIETEGKSEDQIKKQYDQKWGKQLWFKTILKKSPIDLE